MSESNNLKTECKGILANALKQVDNGKTSKLELLDKLIQASAPDAFENQCVQAQDPKCIVAKVKTWVDELKECQKDLTGFAPSTCRGLKRKHIKCAEQAEYWVAKMNDCIVSLNNVKKQKTLSDRAEKRKVKADTKKKYSFIGGYLGGMTDEIGSWIEKQRNSAKSDEEVDLNQLVQTFTEDDNGSDWGKFVLVLEGSKVSQGFFQAFGEQLMRNAAVVEGYMNTNPKKPKG